MQKQTECQYRALKKAPFVFIVTRAKHIRYSLNSKAERNEDLLFTFRNFRHRKSVVLQSKIREFHSRKRFFYSKSERSEDLLFTFRNCRHRKSVVLQSKIREFHSRKRFFYSKAERSEDLLFPLSLPIIAHSFRIIKAHTKLTLSNPEKFCFLSCSFHI